MKKSLGQFLKSLREDAGLTLRAVEEATGVSNPYLSQVESDKIKQPSPTVLHKLSDLYKTSYSTLLRLAGYPVPGEKADADNFELVARIGPVTQREEDAIVEYLEFLRSRPKRGGTRK